MELVRGADTSKEGVLIIFSPYEGPPFYCSSIKPSVICKHSPGEYNQGMTPYPYRSYYYWTLPSDKPLAELLSPFSNQKPYQVVHFKGWKTITLTTS